MAFDLKSLISDPHPDLAFEVSEAGLAWAKPGAAAAPNFTPLDEGVLSVSPLRDNILKADAFAAAVGRIAGASTGRKRRRAVLVLPDFCARVAVLDFDAFPSDAAEQLSLVRFRMKKSVPFDVEDSAISYHAQTGPDKRVSVVVVAAALEIIARYEAPFRAAGLQTGVVTTSSIAALEMDKEPGIALLLKLTGRVLSVSVLKDRALRLLRTVELPEVSAEDLLAVLVPTLAYVEDELGGRPARLVTCGFGPGEGLNLEAETGIPIAPLTSRWGTPGQTNAGLLGYLESIQ
jgi:type IV pilus assembly protein PilM